MADPVSPPKKKKLPFKPTALRRAAAPAPTASPAPAGAEDSSPSNDGPRADDLALFRRGKEMAPMLAADLERRRKKKERQKQAEDERRRSSLGEKRSHDDEEQGEDNAIGDGAVISPLEDAFSPLGRSLENRGTETAVADDLFTPPPSKRSRNNDSFAHEANATVADTTGSQEYPGFTQASPSTRTTRSQANRHPQPETTQLPPPSTAAIVLDSDSEPDIHAVKPTSPHKPRERSVEITQESQALDDDDDFADYVRKAEAERARQREEQQRQQQAQQDVFSPSGRNTTPSTTQNAEILVTSSIPGSTPCKALVRFDQPLRLLRDSWAAKQRNRAGLPIQDSDTILTWRRSRVYNTSTLYNLNLSPLGDGRIKVPSTDGTHRTYSSTSTDGLSNDRTQVLFEAWTTASFAEMEREEARRKEGLPSSQPDGHASDDDLGEDEEEEEDITLKVLLRARGLPDIGLTVRPATTSETLIMAFRNQVTNANPDAIPAGMGVQLWFDGEQLEEHMTLEEADIADRDIIEVHLRPT